MPNDNSSFDKQPLITHLIELRNRILLSILIIFIAFLAIIPFSAELYLYISAPIRNLLPNDITMIATEVASPFLTPFKLALISAIFLTMPHSLYQTWAFLAPGLYKKEKIIVVPLFLASIVLFYAGIAFVFYLVFPLIFAFFSNIAPDGISLMPDIRSYLDFVLKLFFAFGISFQVPIGIVILSWTNALDPYKLSSKRPYVIIMCFIVGMLMTPPDVISQIMLAVPTWLLFELGLILGKLISKKNQLTSPSTIAEE
ncbi:MAG: twin-arginine translocase subunit TatC [Gammaproteobacteria bacterium]|nr:twin-arginine translocase subunit TatC [Gammaproteobacteria bacterium]